MGTSQTEGFESWRLPEWDRLGGIIDASAIFAAFSRVKVIVGIPFRYLDVILTRVFQKCTIDQYTILDDDTDSAFSITQSITLEGAITGKIRTLEEISIEFDRLARLKIGATSGSVINSARPPPITQLTPKGFILKPVTNRHEELSNPIISLFPWSITGKYSPFSKFIWRQPVGKGTLKVLQRTILVVESKYSYVPS